MAKLKNDEDVIRVTKIDAARRQLRTAINLWFSDGDPVSIHTLAYAAYEIVHVVSGKNGRTRDLILDSLVIKDEYAGEWKAAVKKAPNFFKHADKDADKEIEFNPAVNEILILFCVLAIELMGLEKENTESAFIYWLMITHPERLTPTGKQSVADIFPADEISKLRRLSRPEFLHAYIGARVRINRN